VHDSVDLRQAAEACGTRLATLHQLPAHEVGGALGGLEVRVVLPRSPAAPVAAGLQADTENRAVAG